MAQVTFDFSGTTTVVTGGASGIGLAIAETIVRSGGDVVISASRNPSKTESALDRLLDSDYHADCEADTSPEVPLADVRAGLASISGDMTADFAAERDER